MNSPDIIYDVIYKEKEIVTVPVYYDTKSDMYYSIHKDFCRVTSEESTESIVVLTVDNDEIKVQHLAYKLFEYNNEPVISYWDYKQGELSEESYKKLEECTYPDLQEMEMTWKWHKVTGDQMANMDQGEIRELLINLYNNFTIVEK